MPKLCLRNGCPQKNHYLVHRITPLIHYKHSKTFLFSSSTKNTKKGVRTPVQVHVFVFPSHDFYFTTPLFSGHRVSWSIQDPFHRFTIPSEILCTTLPPTPPSSLPDNIPPSISLTLPLYHPPFHNLKHYFPISTIISATLTMFPSLSMLPFTFHPLIHLWHHGSILTTIFKTISPSLPNNSPPCLNMLIFYNIQVKHSCSGSDIFGDEF